MLVLSRKVGERIHIGDEVFVEVRRVAGKRVTLAINAPKTIRILRGELIQAAEQFDVLEDAPAAKAAKDTVIIKHADPSTAAEEAETIWLDPPARTPAK